MAQARVWAWARHGRGCGCACGCGYGRGCGRGRGRGWRVAGAGAGVPGRYIRSVGKHAPSVRTSASGTATTPASFAASFFARSFCLRAFARSRFRSFAASFSPSSSAAAALAPAPVAVCSFFTACRFRYARWRSRCRARLLCFFASSLDVPEGISAALSMPYVKIVGRGGTCARSNITHGRPERRES